MDEVPLFLNGPLHHGEVTHPVAEKAVMGLLHTIRDIAKIGRPVVIGSEIGLYDYTFTDGFLTMGSFASVDMEWQRFIKKLDHKSPFAKVPQCVSPSASSHRMGDVQEACLWSVSNSSFTLSFPIIEKHKWAEIMVELCDCGDKRHLPYKIYCRNFSVVEHVETWREAVLDFGYIESSTSAIYKSTEFTLKMYLNDHEPPHVHVYQGGGDRACVAKVRFDRVEVMESRKIDARVKRDVLAMLKSNRDALMRAWNKCRSGQLPNKIEW